MFGRGKAPIAAKPLEASGEATSIFIYTHKYMHINTHKYKY